VLVHLPALEIWPELLAEEMSCVPCNANVLGDVMRTVDCFVTWIMPKSDGDVNFSSKVLSCAWVGSGSLFSGV
jgi:hypothetical protein